MQRAVVADAHDVDRVVDNINALVTRARETGTPVVWIAHADDDMPEGTDGWQYLEALQPAASEPFVKKNHGDSFEDTDLESVLSERGVGKLVVTGAQTDACIRSTLHGAVVRGYDTTLVGDAHTTMDLRPYGSPIDPQQAIEYTNLYWNFSGAPGRRCATVKTADVTFD